MPSFDIVSEVNLHEAANAVDQANREVGTRFDFKGTGAHYELDGSTITLHGENEFQLRQMLDILQLKLGKRGIDIACLKIDPPQVSGRAARQTVILRQGIDAALAKTLTRLIKDSKLKVQAAIQGEQVRVTGKQRDDLQAVIALLRGAKLDLPLQFTNFRD
ncbi:YajQ family cyclic di-GMP-binding protein [Candidatus Methylocalor cossyra]|uniref:Nucleotide-binding protein MECH1_V1_2543 n=1 Tax=Candidatus Methylocalor cossyra TaxID=3108543 RepID=A0ABM9NL00_9GAMM